MSPLAADIIGGTTSSHRLHKCNNTNALESHLSDPTLKDKLKISGR